MVSRPIDSGTVDLFACDVMGLIVFSCSDKRPEQSIAAARASVMVYDDLNKKWVPAGSSHGLSKVITMLIHAPRLQAESWKHHTFSSRSTSTTTL